MKVVDVLLPTLMSGAKQKMDQLKISKDTHNPLSCVLLLECVSYRRCDALKMEHTVCHFVKNKHRNT